MKTLERNLTEDELLLIEQTIKDYPFEDNENPIRLISNNTDGLVFGIDIQQTFNYTKDRYIKRVYSIDCGDEYGNEFWVKDSDVKEINKAI